MESRLSVRQGRARWPAPRPTPAAACRPTSGGAGSSPGRSPSSPSRGLDGTTRDLARALGITQSLLFKYFPSKAELLKAVYAEVYLDRMSPEWPAMLSDRSRPLRGRMLAFYDAYSRLIFERSWMRIFMFSGLAGAELNRRYLEHLADVILRPLLEELHAAAPGSRRPDMEDIWNLHGGIVYIGIRRHIYQVPCPDDAGPAIEAALDRFLRAYDLA